MNAVVYKMIAEAVASFGIECDSGYIDRLHRMGLLSGPRVPIPSELSEVLAVAVVASDKVQKFVLDQPYNSNRWRAVGSSLAYTSKEQLGEILKDLIKEKQGCWIKAETPSTKPDLRDALPLHEIGVRPVFWRAEDYESFEAAHADGATYVGEWVEGWSALADVMRNVGIACDCVNRGSGDSIRARIVLGGHFYDVDRFAKQI